MTTYFTLIASIFDGLNACPETIKQTPIVQNLLYVAESYLPFFKLGMGGSYQQLSVLLSD